MGNGKKYLWLQYIHANDFSVALLYLVGYLFRVVLVCSVVLWKKKCILHTNINMQAWFWWSEYRSSHNSLCSTRKSKWRMPVIGHWAHCECGAFGKQNIFSLSSNINLPLQSAGWKGSSCEKVEHGELYYTWCISVLW